MRVYGRAGIDLSWIGFEISGLLSSFWGSESILFRMMDWLVSSAIEFVNLMIYCEERVAWVFN